MKTWRFVTIMLVAVALSAALAHLMELPGKMTYDGHLYVLLHRTLYPMFGQTAGWAEGFALVSVVGLVWCVRGRGAAFPLTITAAVCQLAAMVVFLAVVQPVNTTIASWPLDAIPPDWEHWRDRWEYGHAVRAVLELVALGALVLSVVRETPVELPRGQTIPSPGPAATMETPRQGSNAVVVCDTPRDGLRVVYVPDGRKVTDTPPERE